MALGIICFYSRAALKSKVLVIVGTFPLPSNNKGIQSDKKSLSRFLQRAQKTIQLVLPFNLALCARESMLKFLWSIVTLKHLTDYIDEKIDSLLVDSKVKRATFLFSLGTFIKLFFVLYAIYFVMSMQQEVSPFIYYVTLVEELVGIALCGVIFFGNYLKLQKRSLKLKSVKGT